ncbi:hypothetical protein AB0N93_04505 [Streptomyces sp. NPDC091267]|uniref:hypothetical protein n=1 Tax=unclassified Streptomyces TaxID=2593676 RepID=UPI0034138119
MATQTSPAQAPQDLGQPLTGRRGDSPLRPDASRGARGGERACSPDLRAGKKFWGEARRGPHVRARIIPIDSTEAGVHPGVHAVPAHTTAPPDHHVGERPH